MEPSPAIPQFLKPDDTKPTDIPHTRDGQFEFLRSGIKRAIKEVLSTLSDEELSVADFRSRLSEVLEVALPFNLTLDKGTSKALYETFIDDVMRRLLRDEGSIIKVAETLQKLGVVVPFDLENRVDCATLIAFFESEKPSSGG